MKEESKVMTRTRLAYRLSSIFLQTPELNVECGDSAFRALTKKDSSVLWRSLPDTNRRYYSHLRDCENYSVKKMLEASDFCLDWTDIDDLPPAIFEIRGTVWMPRKERWVRHSMNIEFFADGDYELREPQRDGETVPTSFMKDPWLVYQC